MAFLSSDAGNWNIVVLVFCSLPSQQKEQIAFWSRKK
jgi:hypothetical protein